ncbi:copper amine oxidase [Armillaria mellea]|nr:copper amine oxidase [Armillaria mellea]
MGILQVYVAQDGEKSKYRTLIVPNVNAQYHQHLCSVHVDPKINSLNNTETVLKKEAGRPYDWEKEWRWRIVNPARQHYSSGKDVGYVVACRDIEDEQGSKMWPVGKFVSKMRESPMDAINLWVKGEQNIKNEDILVYLTINGSFFGACLVYGRDNGIAKTGCDVQTSWTGCGLLYMGNKSAGRTGNIGEVYMFVCAHLTAHAEWLAQCINNYNHIIGTMHIPHPEDWPVMPIEHLSIMLEPQSFFMMNPSMDIPGTRDLKSVAAFSQDSSNNEAQSNCHCD